MMLLTLLLAVLGSAGVNLALLRSGLLSASKYFLPLLIISSLWALNGNIVPLSTVIASVAMAEILRITRSWNTVLCVSPFITVLWALLLMTAGSEYVNQLLLVAEQSLESFKTQLIASAVEAGNEVATKQLLAQIPTLDIYYLVGNFAIVQLMLSLISVLIARGWQSKLYNPGGLQQEIHQLRLTKRNILVLLLAVIVCSNIEGYQHWTWLFLLPLISAGIAIVHGMVAVKQLGSQWLVGFYILFISFAPTIPLLMLLVMVDNAADLRRRLAS